VAKDEQTEVSDKDLRRGLYRVALMALYLPPFVGGALSGITGFYPMPEIYGVFLSYSGLYLLAVSAGVLWFCASAGDYVIALQWLPKVEAIGRIRRVLGLFPWYLTAFVSVYSFFGALSADFSLVRLGVRQGYTLAQHAYSALWALPAVAITVFPIVFYFFDMVGRYLGARGMVISTMPLRTKLFMLGILTPLLANTMLVAYYSNRDGRIDAHALQLWTVLIVLAVIGLRLAWRSIRQGLAPLQSFIAAAISADRAHQILVPQSLDELGVLTLALRERINEEEQLSRKLEQADGRLVQAGRITGLGIFDHDQVNDTLYWSPEQRNIYGVGPDEAITLQVYLSRLYPDDLERIRAAVQQAHDPAGDGFFDVEHRIIRGDGHIRWLLTRSQTFFEGEGDVRHPVRTVGAQLDITESKEAEEALRKSEEQNRAIIEAVPDILFRINREGIFLDCHSSDQSPLYVPPEQFLAKRVRDVLPPEVAEPAMRAIDESLRSRTLVMFEYQLRIGEEERIFEDRTVPLFDDQVLLVIRDITERRRAEAQLRESEERYRTLFEGSTQGILVMDIETRRFRYANPAMCQLLGYPEEELLRVATADLHPPGTLDSVLAGFAAAARNESRVAPPVPLLRKDGKMFYAEIAGAPMTIQGRRCVVGFFSDITERVRSEEAIRRLNEELELKVATRTKELAAANRELEAFAYSVSHDLRAPLRGIDGFSQVLVLQYGDKLDPEARRLLERIRAGAQRMGHLITDLLQLSRVVRSAVESAEVDISALAQSVVGELKAEAANRTVEWRIEPGMKVRGDRNLLRIALVNLLGNALKYTRDAAPACIEFCVTRRADDLVEYCVRDNGAGFDMAYAERLFQPFQRLHAPHEFEGTGIGLATVQRVIAKHGGDVRGEGRPGAGASFYFTLPA
jgi:PAS domain S-box-containing protein